MSQVDYVGVEFSYGSSRVVKNFNLNVRPREIFTLLGPSGCGKTTVLRLTAGLLRTSAGETLIDGKVVSSSTIHFPPEKRGLGLVFQSYALWPHKTVYENITAPLKIRGITESAAQGRFKEVVELLGLGDVGERYPSQLSGGQQQRVALARAIIYNPRLLLLDEPLSNLDAMLRERTRFELRQLIKRLELTAIYVTHDQTEAMALSDRVGIMRDGQLVQIGTPIDIYARPRTTFVAKFMGSSNFIPGKLTDYRNGYGIATTGLGEIKCVAEERAKGTDVTLCVRPQDVTISREEHGQREVMMGVIAMKIFLGDAFRYDIKVCGQTLQAQTPADLPEKANVAVRLDADRVVAVQT